MIVFDNTPGSGQKSNLGSTYPDHAIGSNEALQRVEPLLNPQQLKDRFLFGIPLSSALTKQQITDEMLKDVIIRAINTAELDAKIQISPVQFRQKFPFDRSLYTQWVHINVPRMPIMSVQSLTITTADGNMIFKMPNNWIESNNFYKGLINVIPLSPSFASIGSATTGATGGMVFLTMMSGLAWIPSYWMVEWVAGFDDKSVPVIINELIGVVAAQKVLSMLGATKQTTGHALGADGLSQSVSNPGPQTYALRMQDLEKDRLSLVQKLRTIYGSNFYVSNI